MITEERFRAAMSEGFGRVLPAPTRPEGDLRSFWILEKGYYDFAKIAHFAVQMLARADPETEEPPHEKAREIVEAIRGKTPISFDPGFAYKLDFRAAVGMVADAIRPNGIDKLRDISVDQLRNVVTIAKERGWAGSPWLTLDDWLREQIEDRDRHRAHNVALTAQLHAMDVADEQPLGIAQDLNRRLYELAQEFGINCVDVISSLRERLDFDRSFVSKETFEATERGRLDAIGELRAVQQALENTRFDLKRAEKDRDDLRAERDRLKQGRIDLRERVRSLHDTL